MLIHITAEDMYMSIEDVDTDIDIYSPADSDEETYAAMSHIALCEIGDDSTEAEPEVTMAAYWDGATRLVRISTSSLLARAFMAYMHVTGARELARLLPRSAYFSDDGYIYTSHGLGYDWIDMDLLSGTGDGSARKRFESAIRAEGVCMIVH